MARILIADNTEGANRLRAVLEGREHDITIVSKLSDAVATSATERFDLIIVGVLFDESQMYELIGELKKNPKLEGTPVMGFSETHTAISRASRNSSESGTHLLGACDYVDTEGMSNDEILERIDACLMKRQGVGRKVQKGDETPAQKREQQQTRREGKPKARRNE